MNSNVERKKLQLFYWDSQWFPVNCHKPGSGLEEEKNTQASIWGVKYKEMNKNIGE